MTSVNGSAGIAEASDGAMGSFAYRAQTEDGRELSGTVDALNVDDARGRLESLRLRVTTIEPTVPRPAKAKPLKSEDFLAFNQQLASLTAAGMPVEYGLRLIAQDLHSGRLAETVRVIADELDRGTDLAQAFEKHRGSFPKFYGQVVSAGIKANNLSGVLLGLGRYGELVQRLRSMLWRTCSYPLAVFVALCLVLMFLGGVVMPRFRELYQGFGMELPGFSQAMLAAAPFVPWVLWAVLAVLALAPVGWHVLRMVGWDRAAVDKMVTPVPMPLVGAVMRWNLSARWCDALRLGVDAGMDLPEALRLASDAMGSPALRRDGEEMIALLERGEPLAGEALMRSRRILPAIVPAAIQLGCDRHDLASVLGGLVESCQQQAEQRMGLIPAVLLPVLLVAIAATVGAAILAIMLPMMQMIRGMIMIDYW
jgi:type II secretory pathway component PulF